MDPHHHQHNQQQQEENGSSCVGGVRSGSKVGFLCRQSSTCRWIPTSDQIRILRDLYHKNGIRSPSNEQIQRISARLRQYGKIEGKNVFYWFQNHKARERRKKKLTVDVHSSNAAAAAVSSSYCNSNTKCKDINSSGSGSSVVSPGVTTPCSSFGYYVVGQIGSGGYSSDAVFSESKLRDHCCIPDEGDGAGPAENENRVESEAAETPPWMMYHCTPEHETFIATTRKIEALPLFPMNAATDGVDLYRSPTPSKDSYNYLQTPFSCGSRQQPEELCKHCIGGGSTASAVAASLELALNSYYGTPPGST